MKPIVFVFILLLGNTAFSQRIDSLHVIYDVGCDCSYVIDSMELRGGCEKNEKIDYHKQKQVYRVESFISKRKFRQWEGKYVSDSIADSITKKFSHRWEGGFGPNLIVDSIKDLSSFRNRKISTNELDVFLKRICSIQTDTVFPHSIKEIPERFLMSNSLTRGSCEIGDIDSLLQEEFYSISISGAIARLHIFFKIEGVSCCLIKSSDYDWTLLTSDSDKRKKFVYFAFDTFLLNELPKNFSGIKVLD